MVDLEDKLRAEVIRRSEEEYEPSADLPDRIEARALQVRRQRQRLAAGAVVAGVAAAVLAVILLPLSDPGGDDVQIGDEPRESSSTTTSEATTSSTTTPNTTAPSTTAATSSTTVPSQQTSTTAGTPEAPTGPLVGPDTPLSWSGIGPITAGMTLREAEAAAGVAITLQDNPPAGYTCVGAFIEGNDALIQAERTGAAGEDLMSSVVRKVTGRSTVDGVAIGDPVSEVTAIYGEPIDTQSFEDGEQWLYFESGGNAYAFLTNQTEVRSIEAGDRAWVGDRESCAPVG
jgi:hypothetical protein